MIIWKAETTIRQPVRATLRLKEGDKILCDIDLGRFVLIRARSEATTHDSFQTFAEWDSEADNDAYAKL